MQGFFDSPIAIVVHLLVTKTLQQGRYIFVLPNFQQ